MARLPTRDPASRQPAWRRYLRFWGRDFTRDLDDELRYHLEARIDEYVAQGLNLRAARAEAARRFGDIDRVRAACTTIESQWQREQTIMDFAHRWMADVRHAVRQLRRNPSLSVAAMLCFALGIGATTSIFSVVDGVLFRPLPFADPGRLVVVGEWIPNVGGENFGAVSEPEFTDYQRLEGRIFARVASYLRHDGIALSGAGEPERVDGLDVTPSLFATLGVRAQRGRVFGATDDTTGGVDAIIVSDALWHRRFSGRDIVGQTIDVDGKPRTIVGIMPASFTFPLPGVGGQPVDVFLPLRMTAAYRINRGSAYDAYLLARLAPGVTVAQAKRAANDLVASYATLYPEAYRGGWKVVADVFPFRNHATADVRTPLLILLGAVALVLLVACLNVASLLLARAAARQREIAVRQALGASRTRLAQQFLWESLVLVVAGGAIGVLLAVFGARAIALHAPADVLHGYDASIDLRVLGVTSLVVVVTAVIFSLVPALSQRYHTLGSRLRDEARGSTASAARARGRRTLVAAEVAIALVLSTGAGLMARSFARALGVDPGFDPNHLVTVRVGLPDAKYATPATVLDFDRRVIDGLRTLPGVTSASASLKLPLQEPMRILIAVEGKSPSTLPIANGSFVMPQFLETMRIRLLAGRPLDASDVRDRLPVVVVNDALAKHFFGSSASAVGKRIKWGAARSPAPWLTIVGVTADVKDAGLDQKQEWSVYFPALQAPDVNVTGMMRSFAFVARGRGDDAALVRGMRRIVRAIDPDMPVVGPTRMTDIAGSSLAGRRFNTYIIAAFALLALALASVGIYGLVAYSVVLRTREIGVRLALGALPGSVVRLVIGQGARLALVGIVVGLAGALVLTRLMRTLLFNVSPFDVVSFASAALLLLAVAVLASLLPAWRASRTDPQAVMRAD
ncbi:MAG TPA: ABC transporter permease [Gemmatimonadaceae bacterium]|nr:ABC transporter permease [Gemmatimonadaceae bacterium]